MTDTSAVLFPLSGEMQKLIDGILSSATQDSDGDEESSCDGEDDTDASNLGLDNAVGPDIRDVDETTEQSSLQYLSDHVSNIHVPGPLGLVRIGHYLLLFSSLVSGEDLENFWPRLSVTKKQDISSQIGVAFSILCSTLRLPEIPLGGVNGKKCKDIRRHIRHSTRPTMTVKELEEFLFSEPQIGRNVYIKFLKGFLLDVPECKYVFTHSYLRSANIRVQGDGEGNWKVSGIIDWELSGFCPEYSEDLKMANNLGNIEHTD